MWTGTVVGGGGIMDICCSGGVGVQACSAWWVLQVHDRGGVTGM